MTTASQTPGEPTEFDALAALAQREARAGRMAEAAAAYRKILALRPDVADTYNNLGNVLIDQGKLDEAAAQFQRAVTLEPGLVEAHNNLGAALRKQGKLEQALAHLEQAIARRPDFAEAYYNLGNVLKDQGKLQQAAVQFERAVALKPGLFQAHNNLGSILRGQGKLDQATACFSRALAINPHYPDAHNNLGKVLEEEGKFDEAVVCYEQALSLWPDHAEAHYNRANLKTFRAHDADLAALEAIAADPNRLPAGKMVYIHFALGKALEDVGDYPRAFEQWILGNALKRREVNFDEAAYQQTCQLVADVFDASLFDRFAAAGDSSSTPIFVLGMPRSGSTLVEQILASHPQVQAAGELENLERVVKTVGDSTGRPVPYPTWIAALDANILRRLGQAYLASLPTPPAGKTRIVDKAPSNFLRVGLIRLILPGARIVHTVRGPVDTCVSCFSRLFNDLPFSYDLAELGRYYRGYYELMAHWRSVLPAGTMLDVAYEDVLDNLEQQVRQLIDFCGLPWDNRCLSFHETSRPIATSSNVQVRRPLYRSSLDRWRRYEAYLSPLLAELEPCHQPK
jgi:tetratricopeptide (TPR) repeat protein